MLDTLWSRLLVALEPKVHGTALDSWLRPCRLAGLDGDHLRVAAPTQFARDWVARHHANALQAAASDVLGGHPRVSVELDRQPERAGAGLTRDEAPPPATALAARYTFDTFVVGPSNQFAHATCQTVAQRPAKAYNPLFIYGGVGLGKTHLLHAVGHEISRLFPSLRLLYLSTERFTNDLINAIRYDRTAEFRAKYRTIDLLLIDDIQFISGKERTQEELFHTFNDLYEARKQIVVSSDSAPKEIPEIEERLRSRFEWGLVASIQPPDLETRVAIINKRAETEGVRLPDEVAQLIASRVKANIREIEGSLTRVIAFCSLSGREMSVELAQEALADLWGEEAKIVTIEHIQRAAAEFFGVSLSGLRAQDRTRAVAFPRQVAMYLARQLTHASLMEIGRAFGGKDHTTVLHAVDKIQRLRQQDAGLQKSLDVLTRRLAP